jgi:uncharacterized protein (TIGR01777 family)
LRKNNILITGASGLIGKRLTELLLQKGHQVSHVGRKKSTGPVPSYEWDVKNGILDLNAFKGIDTIIHLAGAGIADKPWTKERKAEILESRTQSTQLLHKTLQHHPHTVQTFISASAIGYYGFEASEKLFTENSEAGNDFLASVTRKWEEEVEKLKALPLRVAKIRIGIVLSTAGGALKPMLLPIKYFAGSPLGSGKQWMSWIHIDDLCAMFIHLVENEKLDGVYNATAPMAATNGEFTKAIAAVLKRPIWLPNVPEFVLNLLLGEMASLITQGNKVSSKKIQESGFVFQYPTLQGALENLLGKG